MVIGSRFLSTINNLRYITKVLVSYSNTRRDAHSKVSTV